jgi:hypothetical protein
VLLDALKRYDYDLKLVSDALEVQKKVQRRLNRRFPSQTGTGPEKVRYMRAELEREREHAQYEAYVARLRAYAPTQLLADADAAAAGVGEEEEKVENMSANQQLLISPSRTAAPVFPSGSGPLSRREITWTPGQTSHGDTGSGNHPQQQQQQQQHRTALYAAQPLRVRAGIVRSIIIRTD